MNAAFVSLGGLMVALVSGQVSAGCYSKFHYQRNNYYTVCEDDTDGGAL